MTLRMMRTFVTVSIYGGRGLGYLYGWDDVVLCLFGMSSICLLFYLGFAKVTDDDAYCSFVLAMV